MNYPKENPTKQVSFLQQCLSGDKQPLGLFLGAGCPMTIRVNNQNPLIPDIAGITESVFEKLRKSAEHKGILESVNGQLRKDGNCNPTVEDLLTHIRALRAVAGSDTVRGLSAKELDKIDGKICNLIHETVDKELPNDGTPYHHVALWANAIRREVPVEIFTTNYDLLMEQALEESRVAYFDGFAGVRKPFFEPRVIEEDMLPSHWTRLWKLHGSINWYQNENREIFRGTTSEEGPSRVIHPSHLKYLDSRRMPYLAMVDRLRQFLMCPNAKLILCGYSFRDKHINETIIQGLQYSQTSVAFALLFGRIEEYEEITKDATKQSNLNVLARNGGIIGGSRVEWSEQDSASVLANDDVAIALTPAKANNDQNKQVVEFELGDFEIFGKFLQQLVGSVRHSWKEAADAS